MLSDVQEVNGHG